MSPLNSYFLQGSPGEQRLIQDLVNEQLKMYGEDVLYLPRKIIGENTVIRENTAAKFDDSFRIEAYLMNYEGFAGASAELLTKFGVRNTDELTLVISKERYDDFVQPIIDQFPAGERKKARRPNEGDLIFFPLEGALFEIKFVEGKKPFYQLRNLYVYELLCERFEFEDEIIDVAQADEAGSTVNQTVSKFGNILTLNLVGTGATAAVASVSGIVTDNQYKSAQYIDLIHDGAYLTAPRVKISKPFFGIGVTATATANIGVDGSILSFNILGAGTQYVNGATVAIATTPNIPSEYVVDHPINNIEPNVDSSYSLKIDDREWQLNTTRGITGQNSFGTVKFYYWYTGSTPTSGYLYQSNFVNIKWVGNGDLDLEIRRTDNAQFDTAVSNESIVLTSGWNRIEFSWDGSIFSLWNTPLGGSRVRQFYENLSGTNYENQKFIDDNVVSLGSTAGGIQYFDHFEIYDTASIYNGAGVALTSRVYLDSFEKGKQALATVSVSAAGTITGINLDSDDVGYGYTVAPSVILSTPENGIQATAVAIMTSRTVNQKRGIDRVLLTNPGYGYTESPTVEFISSSGSGGIATVVINSGVLPVVAISSGGVGYTTDPQVFIQPIFVPESVGVSSEINNAKAEVIRNSNGEVSQILYSNAGAGYTFTPEITFTLPTSDTYGFYEYNEVVTGQRSGATGYVRVWDADDRILKLGTVSGTFQRGESVVGAAGSYKVSTVDTNEFLDEFADNIDIESEADEIVDFSQVNPFGEF